MAAKTSAAPMRLPPTEQQKFPRGPESEARVLGYTDTLDIERQREASGNLPDEPADDPVRNYVPFKNLRGGR